jgi:hypothetical protein
MMATAANNSIFFISVSHFSVSACKDKVFGANEQIIAIIFNGRHSAVLSARNDKMAEFGIWYAPCID